MQGYSTEPAGRQAIGILNIVFGILGVLGWGLATLGAMAAMFVGGAVGAAGRETGPLGALIGGLGFIALVIFVAHAALSGLLIAGGASILNMRPNGRRLSLIYAWITTILHAIGLVMSGFHSLLPSLGGLVYPIILLVLLNQPDWKAAFPE
jgi:hypothetical protein